MSDKEPQITFREEIRANGELSTGDVNVAVDGFLIIRNKYQHVAGITFVAHLASQHRDKIDTLFRSPALRFIGRPLYGQGELLAECVALRSKSNLLEGDITKLDIGVAELPSHPAAQTVVVHFTPTEFAQPEISGWMLGWTGEIKAFSDDARHPTMKVDTPYGSAEFAEHYMYEDAYVDDLKVTVRAPVPTLVLKVDDASRTANVPALIDRLADYLENFEAVVSFLSRRQVRWMEIEVVSEGIGKHQNSDVSSARRFRKTFGSREPGSSLVRAARLGERDLNDVLQTMVASPYQEAIAHTVNYLNAHWRENFAESALASAFTAFETIVNGIDSADGHDVLVSSDAFGEVRSALKRQIKELSGELGFDENIRKEMYSKLTELQRRPVVPRALSLVERYSVDWRDIWPNDADLGRELTDAYARRSRFIHTGRIDDYGDAVADTARIHALTERLVYNVLGGKKDWWDAFAYREVRWIPAK